MNPFLASFKLNLIKVNQVVTKTNTSDIEDGVILKYEKVTTTYHIEQQHKRSVYDVSYRNNVFFKELSSTGRDIYLYVLYNLGENSDVINLKLEEVCKMLNITRPTVIKGIKELTDIAIISKKSQSEYWINPHYLFNGDRIKYYQRNCPECIEVKAEIKK